MMNRARFRLFRLDYVAIREVLNSLDPIDYINFSRASKSCKALASIKKSYQVCLTFGICPVFMIGNGINNYAVRWTKEKQKDGTRWIKTWPDEWREYLLKYSENPLGAMKEFYMHARSLMGIDIDSVVVRMDDFEEQFREILYWLNSTFGEIPAVRVWGNNQRQEKLQYVLDNVKCKNSLKIFWKTTENLTLEIPETIKELRICYGSWITLNYLMSLKMSKFALLHTYLTNKDINFFFKSWMQMKSHKNLESFEINLTNREDFIAIGLRDIPYEMGPTIPGPYWCYTAVEGSFEITRKDGLTASICIFESLMKECSAVMCTRLPFVRVSGR
ncbi:hypothetical protein B9Z55_005641 [Caenorhabditis nigoni]|nr:hypothetical protein B9Z55_005641 [Caenorhabditis nigoni]